MPDFPPKDRNAADTAKHLGEMHHEVQELHDEIPEWLGNGLNAYLKTGQFGWR
jgi:hypothetical protein